MLREKAVLSVERGLDFKAKDLVCVPFLPLNELEPGISYSLLLSLVSSYLKCEY